jgi:hypothetical protein
LGDTISREKNLGILVDACHPTKVGNIKENGGQGWPVQKVRIYLQNNQSKEG